MKCLQLPVFKSRPYVLICVFVIQVCSSRNPNKLLTGKVSL